MAVDFEQIPFMEYADETMSAMKKWGLLPVIGKYGGTSAMRSAKISVKEFSCVSKGKKK